MTDTQAQQEVAAQVRTLPPVSTMAEVLMHENQALTGAQAMRYAISIALANDNGYCEDAMALLAKALSAGKGDTNDS